MSLPLRVSLAPLSMHWGQLGGPRKSIAKGPGKFEINSRLFSFLNILTSVYAQ